MEQLLEAALPVPTIRPETITTTTTNGEAVDSQEFDDLMAVLEVGTVSGTNPTLDVKLQESDASGSGFVDITDATFTQVVASDKSEAIALKNFGTERKRYIRAVGTIGGTDTPTFAYAVELVLGRPAEKPVS